MTTDIYEPREDSFMLQKYVRKFSEGRVLDMGTGSGIQALTAITNPNAQDVIAADVNEHAVAALQKKINDEKIRKLSARQSNLFSNVSGKFNLIIFNPPYLPEDKEIKDRSLYGGKHGWELSERFFHDASRHLFQDGKILFLFSTLTDKGKIERILQDNLLRFEELDSQKLPFETLHLYLIGKTPLLQELEKKGIEDIHYYARGARGMIYTGSIDKSKFIKTHLPAKKEIVKVAIKTKREDSNAEERIANESRWLRILTKHTIGPRFLFDGRGYLVYEFVDGKFFTEWMEGKSRKTIRQVLTDVLQQCFTLDQQGVNKEEMHRPLKHIIVNQWQQPVLIDFERCTLTKKPKNVTQFVEFICRIGEELKRKGFHHDRNELRKAAQEYKMTFSRAGLESIIEKLG